MDKKVLDDMFKGLGRWLDEADRSLGEANQVGDLTGQGFESRGIEFGFFALMVVIIIAALAFGYFKSRSR